MNSNTEREIAEGLKNGDRRAWAQLYDAYASRVWSNIARLMGSDSAAVADVVQETFLAAARSAGNFDPGRGSVWVWLWTIANRQVALYYRKQKPNILLSRARQWWSQLDGQTTDWIDDKADPPPGILEARELATLVRAALNELSPEYQTMLLAKYADNQSAKQIAEQMKCSPDAVRSKLARARRAFKEAFDKTTYLLPDSKEKQL